MISKSQNRRINLQKGRDMNAVSDERLQELIDCADIVCYFGEDGEDIDFESIVEELQSIRKREDGYALLLKSANYDVKRLSEYSDKLAEQNKELIEDSERLAGAALTYKMYKVARAVLQHKELMEKYGKEI